MSKSILKWLLRGLIVTSLGLSVRFDVDREFIQQGPTRLANPYAAWDGRVLRAAADRGLFLKFVNFKGGSRGFTTNIYFRAVYVMYPRPVLVGEPSLVVNDAPQLLAGNSFPDDQWLLDRGVGSVMTIDFDANRKQPFVLKVRVLGM